jgi:phospholipid-binding lipoprotein MlaA
MPAMHSVDEVKDEYVAKGTEIDPWVGFNRSMYKFNYHLDKYVLLPAVSGYEFITPTLVQDGISNVFNNILEVRNLTNCIFQLKGMQTLTTLGRFLTNSTIGIAGIFDVATGMGMEKQAEDFGQTLGYWGVDAGPYLVLPLFGPSSVRDTGGIVVDGAIRMAIINAIDPWANVDDNTAMAAQAGITILEAVDKRHQEPFRYYGSNYPFEYEMVRFLSRKQRELQVMK